MLRYIVNRLLTVIPTLFVVSVVVFGLQQMLPGDAAIALAGESLDPAIVAQIRADRHLDQSIIVQYALWLAGVLQGDLGQSLRNNVSVAQLISEKLPATTMLSVIAMGGRCSSAFRGIISALCKGSGPDYVAMSSAWPVSRTALLARADADPFRLGGARPIAGLGLCQPLRSRRSTTIPAAALLRPGHQRRRGDHAAYPQRHADRMSADYIRTARAKGLERGVVRATASATRWCR